MVKFAFANMLQKKFVAKFMLKHKLLKNFSRFNLERLNLFRNKKTKFIKRTSAFARSL